MRNYGKNHLPIVGTLARLCLVLPAIQLARHKQAEEDMDVPHTPSQPSSYVQPRPGELSTRALRGFNSRKVLRVENLQKPQPPHRPMRFRHSLRLTDL